MTGSQVRSISSRVIHRVRMARLSTEVKQMSKSQPSALSSWPADMACCTPTGVRSTSVQPVKRFSRFQVDSPWRIRTSLYMVVLNDVENREIGGILEFSLADSLTGVLFCAQRKSKSSEFPDRQLDADPGRADLGWSAFAARDDAGQGSQPRRSRVADEPRK